MELSSRFKKCLCYASFVSFIYFVLLEIIEIGMMKEGNGHSLLYVIFLILSFITFIVFIITFDISKKKIDINPSRRGLE